MKASVSLHDKWTEGVQHCVDRKDLYRSNYIMVVLTLIRNPEKIILKAKIVNGGSPSWVTETNLIFEKYYL